MEQAGVGAEQNQGSGNLASPLGLAADVLGKSGIILDPLVVGSRLWLYLSSCQPFLGNSS